MPDSELESMGLVAEPEKPAPPIFRLSRTERIRSNKWPSATVLAVTDDVKLSGTASLSSYTAQFDYCPQCV